jgi:signal transduction histidine kinase/CheY-like chemotaxis protein
MHALRLRGPLAADPTARILHALVLALTIWSAIWTIVTLPLYPNLMARLLRLRFVMVADLVPVTTLILLRLGHFRQATYVYLTGQWVQATYNIAINGSIEITSTAFYITLPILATWLLGFREAFWTAGVCLGSALILALRQGPNSVLPTAPLRPPLLIWANLVQLTLTAAAPVAHILQTLRETLAQSRSAQEELQQYKEHLEQVVELRTAELVVARDQALAASRTKSAFLANMSHELRTPLNAILGFSALVREDPGLSEEHLKDLAIVNRSGEHLLNLIDEVLDVAKIEAGRVIVENAPFGLTALVRDTVEMMRAGAGAKGIELLVNTSSSVPSSARSDAAKLRQVLINLLGNAVKFTEEGSVTLRVYAKPIDADQRLLLIFEVQDTGIGIAAEDQARIFSPFVRVGKAATQDGTGLGLSIAQQFVQMMGGTIRLDSTPGKGSLFRIEVAVERAEEPEVMTSQSDREQVIGLETGQPEYRMLIVEDQKENWLLLQRLLNDTGFQVQVAEDGAQGVEMFRTWKPHLIWMDLRLPVMGGMEAAREIRALDGGRQVKIVALTASAFAQQREDVLAAGLDDFVRKPYRRAEIFDCLARQLGVRYLHRETRRESPTHPVAALRREALAMLPQQLRKELADALVRLDPEPIVEVIDRVSKQDAELGEVLARCSKHFAYTEILSVLEDCNGRFAEGSL